MFKQLKTSFINLSNEVQATIFIRWINKTRNLILTTFGNIFIYQVHGTISWMILSNILYFLGSAVGFYMWWLIIHCKKVINIRHIFYSAFLILSLSFLLMPWLWTTIYWVYLFFLIAWIWSGLFYFSATNYEAVFLDDKERNFYSSTLNAWYTVLKIIAPLIVAWFFYIQPRVNISGYTLLFVATWIIYLYWLKFVATMPDHLVKQRSQCKCSLHYFLLSY